MSETKLGRRDLRLASGAVLTGAGAVARAGEKPRRLKFPGCPRDRLENREAAR